jgi:hypothetical protein
VALPQLIHKDDHCISFPLESDQPCDLEKIEIVSDPVQILAPLVLISEPCHELVNSHDQPTAFQVKIRMKMFKPLKLPLLLHPYPDDCYEYLPLFSGENQTSAEGHAESFLDFVDRFSITHEDVIMRLFSKYLIKDAATWFKSLRTNSIGSWTEFSNAFLKYWGNYKSLESYLADFYALKREQDEALPVFNRRFYHVYYDIPLEIRPTEIAAMVYYLMAQHNELVLLLLERKSSSLGNLFEDAQEVEENIRASRRIRQQVDFDNLLAHEQKQCQYGSDFEQGGNECEADLEQQKAYELISDADLNSSTLAEYSRDRYACEAYDQFVNQEEPMMTDDCIINYMFSAEPNPCDGNLVLLSSCQHYSDNEIVVFDDHELISKGQEDDHSSCRGTVMAEQEVTMDMQLFPEKQHVSYFLFKDPVAVFMDLYFSENLKSSDFLSLQMFMGDSFGSATNAKGSHQLSDVQTQGNCNKYGEEGEELKSPDQQSILHVSPARVEQPTFNNEISKGSFQHHFNLQLDQQLKEVLFYDFEDPIADFLDSISSIDVKIFLSEGDCLNHFLKPLFCMIWPSLLFGSRSIMVTVNQFLTWLHWKHDFT